MIRRRITGAWFAALALVLLVGCGGEQQVVVPSLDAPADPPPVFDPSRERQQEQGLADPLLPPSRDIEQWCYANPIPPTDPAEPRPCADPT